MLQDTTTQTRSNPPGRARRRWRRGPASLLILAGMVLAAPTIAGAANPGSGTTTTGQDLNISIDSPADGATVPAGADLDLSGQAAIGPLPGNVNANVLYTVDSSGSTSGLGNDCNGDGTIGGADDDFNSSGFGGEIIDCEIAGVVALNQSLSGLTGVDGGVIDFTSSATTLDVDPLAAGSQAFTSPLGVDKDGDGVPDIEAAARSLLAGGNTSFDAPLNVINSTFAAQPAGENNIAFFLSDGVGVLSTGAGSPLQAAADAGTVVNTFSVGTGATGCGSGAGLRTIADTTGGTCTEVDDPGDLAAVIGGGGTAAGIDRVEVQIDGGAPIAASVDALSNWSATIPGSAITGPSHLIEATVYATDGTSATADITVVTEAADQPTTCVVTGLRYGPPAQQDVTVNDPDGVASITAVNVINGTVAVPTFTPGDPGPLVLTATKGNQSQRTFWEFDVTDSNGVTTHCV